MNGRYQTGPLRRNLAGVRVRFLEVIDDVRVYLVDGERIREFFTDFTMGGSDARYRFIPRGEVWIEKNLSVRDREATKIHELHERTLMRAGHPYHPAHNSATRREANWRRRHPMVSKGRWVFA